MKNKLKYYLVLLIILCILALPLSGCSVKLIADYDQIIDQNVISLQTQIETFLTHMERTAGTREGQYASQVKFYDEIRGQLNTLSVRAASIPKNEIVTEQIDTLKETIETLREIHEEQGEKGLTKPYVYQMRTAFERHFAEIYKLQQALKRGKPVS